MLRLVTGIPGPSGYGSASNAERVTQGIDASTLTAIITGGASGIGLETARVMALRNAHIIIGARDMVAANEAKRLILNDNKNARVDVLKLDLNSLKSIKTFAENFIALNLPLNILINNAGVMFCPFQLSEDGIETHFATNHIGHFYLTNLLIGKMKNTAKSSGIEGRIVNLSSVAHVYTYQSGIIFDKINDRSRYDEKKAYGQSKLANILHANELSRRLKEEGVDITANSVHPGLIMTSLFKHKSWLSANREVSKLLSVEKCPSGAATTCYVALHPQMKGVSGKYFADCNFAIRSKMARDEVLAEELWEYSNKLIDEADQSNSST